MASVRMAEGYLVGEPCGPPPRKIEIETVCGPQLTLFHNVKSHNHKIKLLFLGAFNRIVGNRVDNAHFAVAMHLINLSNLIDGPAS